MPGAPVDEYEQLAASCDLVVCIGAHRDGYEPEPEPGRGSMTKHEIEAARLLGKPIYAWIVEDAYPWTEPKERDRLAKPEVLGNPGGATGHYHSISCVFILPDLIALQPPRLGHEELSNAA